MPYFLSALGAIGLIMAGLLWNANRVNDNLHADIVTLKVTVKELAIANESSLVAIKQCEKVNATNKTQRDNAEQRAQAASQRIQDMIDSQSEITPYEPTTNDCRTLLDPLPADFAEWLCSAGNNCTD